MTLKEATLAFEEARTLIENDRFAADAGVKLLDISEGYARVSVDISPRHFNGVGIAQGGAIFTLADLAFAAAVNSHGIVTVAINVSITFMKSVSSGTIYAEAREISTSAKLASCTVRVTDSQGTLLAVFQGLAYRKKELVADVVKGLESW
jgi:acyl-CoA thioesterase